MSVSKVLTAVIGIGFLLPISNAHSASSTYNCLSKFHGQFSDSAKNRNLRRHVEGYEIRKRRVRNQNVIVANLIDPLDDKSKKLFVTKTKARVCDPTAEAGQRCTEPQERHVNATLTRHVSILPEMYRDSLTQYKSVQASSNTEAEVFTKPRELINSLSDCRRVSKTIKRRLMMKSQAVTAVYDEVFNIKTDNDDSNSPSLKTKSTGGRSASAQ